MEYLGAGGLVIKSPNVDKGIITLAMNITSILIWKTLKVQHYKQYKRFTTFQKNVTNTTIRTKDCWHSAMRQRKEKFVEKFSCVKERRNSRQSVMS